MRGRLSEVALGLQNIEQVSQNSKVPQHHLLPLLCLNLAFMECVCYRLRTDMDTVPNKIHAVCEGSLHMVKLCVYAT